ncbi:hypothetical protein ND748_06735 [Frankia sp. AiPs1]|uniref:hypothetical protein n=1 Tax=Frankia sp. AiPs1 TaxID=573493 RepID=UPI002043CCFD|nr:hypothetical protein [Frankia sp. AiPs1]MCM3921367.1 hypothetical protein [Frankia sp. AiPs1]
MISASARRSGHLGEQIRPHHRVQPDQPPLLGVQRARTGQGLRRQEDLSNVVQPAGQPGPVACHGGIAKHGEHLPEPVPHRPAIRARRMPGVDLLGDPAQALDAVGQASGQLARLRR